MVSRRVTKKRRIVGLSSVVIATIAVLTFVLQVRSCLRERGPAHLTLAQDWTFAWGITFPSGTPAGTAPILYPPDALLASVEENPRLILNGAVGLRCIIQNTGQSRATNVQLSLKAGPADTKTISTTIPYSVQEAPLELTELLYPVGVTYEDKSVRSFGIEKTERQFRYTFSQLHPGESITVDVSRPIYRGFDVDKDSVPEAISIRCEEVQGETLEPRGSSYAHRVLASQLPLSARGLVQHLPPRQPGES